jgi:hypothetical protein
LKMDKVFGIIPASSGVMTFIWIFSIVMAAVIIGVVALLATVGYQSKHATFTITDQGLKIGPGLYSRTIPKEIIDAGGVRVMDLNIEQNYQPRWRTNGASMPGYSAGWFKLKNDDKALLFVTDRSSVVYIPTTDNYSVMLSVQQATEMVEAIKLWK